MNTNNNSVNTNREYKAFNLAFEYGRYAGEIKYAIATDLTEENLRSKYGDEIGRYEPFIIITWEAGEVMTEYHNNEAKHRMRAQRGEEILISDVVCEFYCEDTPEGDLSTAIRNEYINIALSKLTKQNRERVISRYIYGYTDQEIADATGCKRTAVTKDIDRSLKKLEVILLRMGVCA